jgi:hypothetical protein
MSHSGERRTDSLVKSAVSFGIGQRRESIRAGRIESAWVSAAPQTRRECRGVGCADAAAVMKMALQERRRAKIT